MWCTAAIASCAALGLDSMECSRWPPKRYQEAAEHRQQQGIPIGLVAFGCRRIEQHLPQLADERCLEHEWNGNPVFVEIKDQRPVQLDEHEQQDDLRENDGGVSVIDECVSK